VVAAVANASSFVDRESTSSRRSEASVGIYCPCTVASFAPMTMDPDARSLRSVLRNDRFTACCSLLLSCSIFQ
jgi:hypothetical protein